MSFRSRTHRAVRTAVEYANFLLDYSLPGTVATGRGRHPVVLVTLTDCEGAVASRLRALQSAFGGTLLTEQAGNAALQRTVWYTVGRGAVFADALVHSTIETRDDVPAPLRHGWGAFHTVCRLLIERDSPGDGRRTSDAERTMTRRAADMARGLARARPAYAPLLQRVAGEVHGDLAVGDVAGLGALPSPSEVAAHRGTFAREQRRRIGARETHDSMEPMPVAELAAALTEWERGARLTTTAVEAELRHDAAKAARRGLSVRPGMPATVVVFLTWCSARWGDDAQQQRPMHWASRTIGAVRALAEIRPQWTMDAAAPHEHQVPLEFLEIMATATLGYGLVPLAPSADISHADLRMA